MDIMRGLGAPFGESRLSNQMSRNSGKYRLLLVDQYSKLLRKPYILPTIWASLEFSTQIVDLSGYTPLQQVA